MDDAHGKVQLRQILYQGLVLMARLLHEEKAAFQGSIGPNTINERKEAFARLLKSERRAAFKALMMF